MLGDILVRPAGAAEYLELGCQRDHFHHGVHRVVFAAIAHLVDEGVAPDAPAVGRRLREQGEDVSPAFLYGLPDGVPAQSRDNKAALLRRLEDLRLARGWMHQTDLLKRQILDNPGVFRNGFLSHQIADLESLQGRPTSSTLLDDIAIAQLPEAGWLVEDVIPAGATGTLYGDPGTGKTFATIDLGLAIVTGQSWLGFRVPESSVGTVIYATAEGTGGIRRRLAAAKAARGINAEIPVGFYTRPTGVNLLSPQAVHEFVGECKALQPRLVVFDTLARCMPGGDENSSRDMGLAIEHADRVRKATGACVLLVHHANRSGSGERGSGALRGACDFMLELKRSDDLITLSCSKQKDAGPFAPFAIELIQDHNGSSCTVRRTGAEPIELPAVHAVRPLSEAQTKLLDCLRNVFGASGATSPEWESAISGIHRATYFRARNELVKKGMVRTHKGRYFPGGLNG